MPRHDTVIGKTWFFFFNNLRRNILHSYGCRVSQNNHSLNHILQFTHIARPGIPFQNLKSLFGDCTGRTSCQTALFFDKKSGQVHDILLPLSQRREVKRDNIQTIEKVLSKLPPFNHIFEICICCRNHSYIKFDDLV